MVAGLGNPGREHRRTRHNAGREAVEALAGRLGTRFVADGNARVAEGVWGAARILLVLPETYMNLSGRAVGPRARGFPPHRVLVVVDDVSLEAGRLRLRPGGSAGGHHGLLSVRDALGTADFPRLRIGVGPDPGGESRADYVLERPKGEEAGLIEAAIAAAPDVILDAIDRGVEAAMNRWNAWKPA